MRLLRMNDEGAPLMRLVLSVFKTGEAGNALSLAPEARARRPSYSHPRIGSLLCRKS